MMEGATKKSKGQSVTRRGGFEVVKRGRKFLKSGLFFFSLSC